MCWRPMRCSAKVEMVTPRLYQSGSESATFWASCINEHGTRIRDCGVEKVEHPLSIVVDYGGPNVAKPLHVGHLRPVPSSAKSVKRIARFMGHNVIGDPHLGDWGLQIGLIIVRAEGAASPTCLTLTPTSPTGYPEEPPFTITDLEEIYPFASKVSKEDAALQGRSPLRPP